MSAVPELSGRQPGAVHSALAVLEEVARSGPGITAQQLSARLGLPRATAYRLLNLLVQDEYLVRMPDLRGFALGRKVAELADVARAQDAAANAHQAVAELRAQIRGGVHLAVYREGRVVDDPVHDRVMSARIESLQNTRQRILTSGGPEKIEALLGAMRLLAPTVLITDEESARRMLELHAAG